jgi:AraC-like DNA-binding protein
MTPMPKASGLFETHLSVSDLDRSIDLVSLADKVHVSRATLARRFTDAVGEPPLSYLGRWRMHLAAQRLKHGTETVEEIAHQVGYTSECRLGCADRPDGIHPAGDEQVPLRAWA